MGRLLDKLILGIACLAILVTSEPAAFAIVGVLCAIVASGLAEWLKAPWKLVPLMAFLGACFIWPSFLVMVPLIAYDALQPGPALREGRSAFEVVTLCFCLATLGVAAIRLPALSALFVGLFSGFSLILSWRTALGIERERVQHEVQDALRERGITLEERNRDLRERQNYETELATLAERGRIARDIHDNVGHLLTRASLQVEALRVAYGSDPALDGSLEAVQATVDEALGSVRKSVHALHEETFDLGDKLRETAERFEEESSLTVALTCDFDDSSPKVGLAFLAIVKEALSNVARHSRARSAAVRVVEYPALWQLTVEDDGAIVASDAPATRRNAAASLVPLSSSGMGLATMEERIIALGGHFSAGVRPDGRGWRVFCSVPKEHVSPGSVSKGGISREPAKQIAKGSKKGFDHAGAHRG